LGKFWRALKWKMLVQFMAIWNILLPFGICHGHLIIYWSFGTVSPVWVYCITTNLATLVFSRESRQPKIKIVPNE
jgi:hypothetical protein